MESSLTTTQEGSVTTTPEVVSEIKTLHLQSQCEFLAAGRGFLQRGIRIGELLQNRRQGMLDAHLAFLEKEFPKKHEQVALKVLELQSQGEDPTKIIAREFFDWFEQSGINEVFSSRTATDYLQIYAHRAEVEQLTEINSLHAALRIIRIPKPQLEAPEAIDEEEGQAKTKETPLEKALQSFWNYALAKDDWSDGEKGEYLHDLYERTTFAQRKGWL